MLKTLQIVPSILAADFGILAKEAKRAETSGADGLHVDVMDGHFVPNFSLGPKTVAALNRATHLFLDVHLMIYNPFDYVEKFVEVGADRITFHIEATEHVRETIAFIRKCGIQVGIALSPDTSPELVMNYLDDIDLVLLMSVNPGFGGQTFMEEVIEKIEFVHHARQKRKLSFDIEVDGGINEATARLAVKAGANVLVAGSFLYGSSDMTAAIARLRACT